MTDKLKEVNDVFCQWLRDNGAEYPNIDWPSNKTVSGMRGGVAINNIESNEPMMNIPVKLMMSPLHAFADPVIGTALRDSQHLLRGDCLICVYLMYEMQKKEASFYYPYLATFPDPDNITQWDISDVRQFQDGRLLLDIKNRLAYLKRLYQRAIGPLCRLYPDIFPVEVFDYPLFEFAWNSIQARAFGKRLPWTAMVPFADSLNHTNVQTKYDYNVAENGAFRMFPTGSNRYGAGCEVFNSYGRRPNDNLLLDYGFSMLDNEWDYVEFSLMMDRSDPLYGEKAALLKTHLSLSPNSCFALTSYEMLPLKALSFLRLISLSPAQLLVVQAVSDKDKELCMENLLSNVLSQYDEILIIENLVRILSTMVASPTRKPSSPTPPASENDDVDDYADAVENDGFTTTTLEEDLVLLDRVNEVIRDKNAGVSSTDDEEMSANNPFHLQCALHYRITRKRLIRKSIVRLELLAAFVKNLVDANAEEWNVEDGVEKDVCGVLEKALFVRRMHNVVVPSPVNVVDSEAGCDGGSICLPMSDAGTESEGSDAASTSTVVARANSLLLSRYLESCLCVDRLNSLKLLDDVHDCENIIEQKEMEQLEVVFECAKLAASDSTNA